MAWAMEEGWEFFDQPIGPCVVCHEPCVSTDPAGYERHPGCPKTKAA